MSLIEVQQYLGRARDLHKAMDVLIRDEFYILEGDLVRFGYSPAILGIHSAISYSDALRAGLGSEKLSSSFHGDAVEDLRSRLASRSYENRKGVRHLEALLSKKTRVEYEAVAVRENEVEDIVKHAARFASWADETGRRLRIGGW
jgi:hypothetical protein